LIPFILYLDHRAVLNEMTEIQPPQPSLTILDFEVMLFADLQTGSPEIGRFPMKNAPIGERQQAIPPKLELIS
jgi:hypothetical protein